MAYEIPGRKLTLVAAATITQFKFVKAHTTVNQCTAVGAATDRPIGIAQSGQASGEAVEIMLDGVSKVLVGSGGLTVGQLVTVDSTGKAVNATAPAVKYVGDSDNQADVTTAAFVNLAGGYILGQCLVAALEDDLATIIFNTLNPVI